MDSATIRKKFFHFFTERGHTQVSSSSLIPAQDPTILFTNAGMNQFKDLFLGREKRAYTRAVSIQKCVRAGGKHNDLDNVGFTKRHLTFFEMMGNFSFGDYFKKEAIEYAWGFLTKELALPTDNLHVTVYETDDESYDLWHTMIGIPKIKLHRLGKAENFWSMGDIGPCGPCTEIHVDRGSSVGCQQPDCGPACDCERFLEIWNLVFMQYEQKPDGSLHELVQKGVDTGMGLERLAVVLQGVDSVYETDLFTPLVHAIENFVGIAYHDATEAQKASFHVLMDHARSATLLIADGCAPSNDGRGYVLRKIIRRAALFGQKLTNNNLLFPELSAHVIALMTPFYPDLPKQQQLVYQTLESEIKKFIHNLIRGNNLVKEYVEKNQHTQVVDGKHAFILYDTYGFPLELIILAAQEYGYSVDTAGFAVMMEQQQKLSGKKSLDPLDTCELPATVTTVFTGYDELATNSTVSALIVDTNIVQQVSAGTRCFVIAQRSPFFIVGGGQVPDAGVVTLHEATVPVEVARYINGRIAVQITAPHAINVGDVITLSVDQLWRTKAMKNHTATHLLQSALIRVLGATVKQAGSLVHPDYLRFDFTYHANPTSEQITAVENIVNQKIMDNIPVVVTQTTMHDAVKNGALAFFGDKYNPEDVRMVAVNDFSVELCGGTHVPATGTIGCFKIIETSALSAGHRRIVAVTGPVALETFQHTYNTVKQLSGILKVAQDKVEEQVLSLVAEKKQLQAGMEKEKYARWIAHIPEWLKQKKDIHGVPFVAVTLDGASAGDVRELATLIEQKEAGCFCISSNVSDTQGVFVIQVSPAYRSKISLNSVAQWLKDSGEVRCGGTDFLVQGSGTLRAHEFGNKVYAYMNSLKS